MKTNISTQQKINILNEQISLCDKMLEILQRRFWKNQISKKYFYTKMQEWDEKKYIYINEIENIKKNIIK